MSERKKENFFRRTSRSGQVRLSRAREREDKAQRKRGVFAIEER